MKKNLKKKYKFNNSQFTDNHLRRNKNPKSITKNQSKMLKHKKVVLEVVKNTQKMRKRKKKNHQLVLVNITQLIEVKVEVVEKVEEE
jgi:hypothetical protein